MPILRQRLGNLRRRRPNQRVVVIRRLDHPRLRAHRPPKLHVRIIHIPRPNIRDRKDPPLRIRIVRYTPHAFAQALESGGRRLTVDAARAGVVDFERAAGDLLGDFGSQPVAADEELSFDGFGAVGEEGVHA